MDLYKNLENMKKSMYLIGSIKKREDKNTLNTNLLHKFGAEQINGKPKRKVKIIANFKAFRFVLLLYISG